MTEPTKENLAMDPLERAIVLAIYAALRAAGFVSIHADYGYDWEEGDDFCPTGTDDEIINACTDTGMSVHYFLDPNGNSTHNVMFITGNGRDIASDGCACESFWAPINAVCDRFNRKEFVITLKS